MKNNLSKGLLFALVLTIVLCLYSVIMGQFAVTEGWAGFMFFWFWSSIRSFELEPLKKDIPNSIVGLLLSFGIFKAFHSLAETPYTIIMVLTLFIVLFLIVTEIIPYVIGPTTFLFFTVLTGNLMLEEANYTHIFISYFAGVVFFIITLGAFMKFLASKEKTGESES